jgi:chromosome segregation ATPase
MTDITSSIQFLDKEVRKLWDLSNKRNKVNIQNLSNKTEEIQELLNTIKIDIKENQTNLSSLQDDIVINISKIDELGLSSDDLEELRQKLNNINTQLILLDDSVQALNNYKNQLNQAILEIQTQVSSIQSQTDE